MYNGNVMHQLSKTEDAEIHILRKVFDTVATLGITIAEQGSNSRRKELINKATRATKKLSTMP